MNSHNAVRRAYDKPVLIRSVRLSVVTAAQVSGAMAGMNPS